MSVASSQPPDYLGLYLPAWPQPYRSLTSQVEGEDRP
jgi:hypothetical protein